MVGTGLVFCSRPKIPSDSFEPLLGRWVQSQRWSHRAGTGPSLRLWTVHESDAGADIQPMANAVITLPCRRSASSPLPSLGLWHISEKPSDSAQQFVM